MTMKNCTDSITISGYTLWNYVDVKVIVWIICSKFQSNGFFVCVGNIFDTVTGLIRSNETERFHLKEKRFVMPFNIPSSKLEVVYLH